MKPKTKIEVGLEFDGITTSVTLNASHTHKGIDYHAGAILQLEHAQAKWITKLGVGYLTPTNEPMALNNENGDENGK